MSFKGDYRYTSIEVSVNKTVQTAKCTALAITSFFILGVSHKSVSTIQVWLLQASVGPKFPRPWIQIPWQVTRRNRFTRFGDISTERSSEREALLFVFTFIILILFLSDGEYKRRSQLTNHPRILSTIIKHEAAQGSLIKSVNKLHETS